jgi:hypothetical protein
LSTLVSFIPDDGVGVIVFANGGDKGKPVADISNRIFDAALHLRSRPSPPMFVFRYLFPPFRFAHIQPSMPEKKAFSSPENIIDLELALEEFSGTYNSTGYGSFAFCSPSSSSSYCHEVITDFAVVDTAKSNAPSSPQLLAAWPRVWASHIRAMHQSGNKFLVHWTSLFPEGYGSDNTPFETAEIGTSETRAEFVVEDGKVVGFGLFGLVLNQLSGKERTHTTVKGRADVWFDKV